ncbi:hypothetical protein [Enterococcus sp. DIV1368e]|uniref:hypothetical protein n=1 Tax=Enterococcus sp. DIV1368e TaxID=2774799 RepID=UPI003F20F696
MGIDKYADVAYQSIDNLSKGILRITTPEIALGASSMGMEARGTQIINQSYSTQSPYTSKIAQALTDLANKEQIVMIEDTNGLTKIIGKTMARGGF